MIFVVTSGKGEDEEEDSGDEAGGAGCSWTEEAAGIWDILKEPQCNLSF